MSKKKKFTGKKTKLAEHALTQVLEQERSGPVEFPEPPSPNLTLAQAVQTLRNEQLHLELPSPEGHSLPTQGQLELANGYLALLQDLEDMREMLRAPRLPSRPRTYDGQRWSLPNTEIMHYSLRVIGHTLREIRSSLG
jgi:hypothetical protein